MKAKSRGGRRRRGALLALLFVAAATLTVFVLFFSPVCPRNGAALTAKVRAFSRLKNRDTRPRAEEFDRAVTLAEILRPGDDRARWTETRAAAIEGYVVGVSPGGIEAANCYSVRRRDTHIYVAASADAGVRERMVVEVTPRVRAEAARRGLDWSESALRHTLVGRRCRFEGWLLYDIEHDEEAENTAPARAGNWRATSWEIHPVTKIEVVEGP
ncbi:MAG TPA: hypothetical protein VFX96_14600 [Pyrinomonadaceae bacterium]|nr:hypothetical protein [Pyrinomonadaceae bacterium]